MGRKKGRKGSNYCSCSMQPLRLSVKYHFMHPLKVPFFFLLYASRDLRLNRDTVSDLFIQLRMLNK